MCGNSPSMPDAGPDADLGLTCLPLETVAARANPVTAGSAPGDHSPHWMHAAAIPSLSADTPGGALSRRMSTLARRDTVPSWRCGASCTAAGCATACSCECPRNRRRTIDIAFTRGQAGRLRRRLLLARLPRARRAPADQRRVVGLEDRAHHRPRTATPTRSLAVRGWTVLRVWEHEDGQALPTDRVLDTYRRLLAATTSPETPSTLGSLLMARVKKSCSGALAAPARSTRPRSTAAGRWSAAPAARGCSS